MAIKKAPPAEAAELLRSGWTYLDVRTVEEFAAGHPAGAYNVPLMHSSEDGLLRANPDFDRVVQAHFAKDRQLVIGCATTRRAKAAARQLGELGFDNIIVMRGGFSGETDSLDRVTVEGWSAQGLPTQTDADRGHSYADLNDGQENS